MIEEFVEPAEIRRRIDQNNQEIEKLLSPNIFILNHEVSKLLEDNKKLREICTHEFTFGMCKYCDEKQ